MGKYAKTVVAVLAAALVAIQAALSDDVITNAEKFAIAVAVLTALGVWAVPNQPPPS
jgi:hypothetical protein